MRFFFCIPGKVWYKGTIGKALGLLSSLAVGVFVGYTAVDKLTKIKNQTNKEK